MKKDVFKLLIRDFIERDLSEVKERELFVPLEINKVISIVGMRKNCFLRNLSFIFQRVPFLQRSKVYTLLLSIRS